MRGRGSRLLSLFVILPFDVEEAVCFSLLNLLFKSCFHGSFFLFCPLLLEVKLSHNFGVIVVRGQLVLAVFLLVSREVAFCADSPVIGDPVA